MESTYRRSLLHLANIHNSNDLVKFYTSFPDYKSLIAFYEEVLESDAQVTHQWEGKNSKDKSVLKTFCASFFLHPVIHDEYSLPNSTVLQSHDCNTVLFGRLYSSWITDNPAGQVQYTVLIEQGDSHTAILT